MTPEIVKTEPTPIPAGEYRATWHGYRITFEDHPFTIWTREGNRGWFPVTVHVAEDGKITTSRERDQ